MSLCCPVLRYSMYSEGTQRRETCHSRRECLPCELSSWSSPDFMGSIVVVGATGCQFLILFACGFFAKSRTDTPLFLAGVLASRTL